MQRFEGSLVALVLAAAACGVSNPMESASDRENGGVGAQAPAAPYETSDSVGASDVSGASTPGEPSDAQRGTTDGGAVVDAANPDAPPVDWSQDPPGLAMLSPARLAEIRVALPTVADPWTHRLLTSPSTIWYDKSAIIPGYQDSWGDNVVAPIGFRPNSIAPNMINLAVPGGHALLFSRVGVFHFPFATTGGAEHPVNAKVVDFWWPPRDASGALLPVVWKMRHAGETTHRIEWMFPVGTVLGEVLLLQAPDGRQVAYEVRTRRRESASWRVDVFRPFPRAVDLADAIDARRQTDGRWQRSAPALAVATHARDTNTLRPARLAASHYAAAFDPIDGAVDTLPNFGDVDLVMDLLTKTPFRTARGTPWKSSATLVTWAATTNEEFSIVPKNYDAGFLEVSDATCSRCHADAGRPFSDYYPQVLAYGELWGEDESFSWHPFETKDFVNASGGVVNFNYDNRHMRKDFVDAGLIAPLDRAKHPTSIYLEIPRPWRGYAH